jgi:hypothetical protein
LFCGELSSKRRKEGARADSRVKETNAFFTGEGAGIFRKADGKRRGGGELAPLIALGGCLQAIKPRLLFNAAFLYTARCQVTHS